jgi:hypothetical protein
VLCRPKIETEIDKRAMQSVDVPPVEDLQQLERGYVVELEA